MESYDQIAAMSVLAMMSEMVNGSDAVPPVIRHPDVGACTSGLELDIAVVVAVGMT